MISRPTTIELPATIIVTLDPDRDWQPDDLATFAEQLARALNDALPSEWHEIDDEPYAVELRAGHPKDQ